MSKWTMADVKDIILEVEEMTGEKLDLEVKVNGRLKRAIARCFTKVVNGRHIPTKLEFGKAILEVEDYEIFKQVALHELGHAIANKKYQANCGHDRRFVKVCHEIGCYNTGTHCSEEYSNALQKAYEKVNGTTTTKPKQETTKYHVICKECGHIHHYKKMCQTLENLEGYRCACGGKLKLEQNW